MSELIDQLYYIVEDWIDKQIQIDEEAKNLERQKSALEEEIMLRLGRDGQALMEDFSGLNLKLEALREKALFRAAAGLGSRLAWPDGVPSTPL